MSRLSILMAGILLMGLLAGCEQDTAKDRPKPAPSKTVPQILEPAPAPRAYPVTGQTRTTYQFYCAQCHGTEGHGDGINAPHLTVPPRDHTKADYLETRTDEQLFIAIQQGGLSVGRAPCMPGWGHTLDEDTLHSLVNYIRELCRCESL